MAAQAVPAINNRMDALPRLAIQNSRTRAIAIRIDEELREQLEVQDLDRENILNARRFLRMSLNETLEASQGTLENISPEDLQATLVKISVKAASQGLFNNGVPETVNLMVNANPKSKVDTTLSFVVKTSTGAMFTGLAVGNIPLVGGSIITLGACAVYSLGDFIVNQIKK